ncbi:MAG: DUF2314 domain-containing protein [Planctomycetota bacterium]|nr:DUF2314 domain-containing protein [Planctomycetota bacterium]
MDTEEKIKGHPERKDAAGILAVDPITIKKHKKGDEITPQPEEVIDWVIPSRDGSRKGGFTIDVIEKRRVEANKSEQGSGGNG